MNSANASTASKRRSSYDAISALCADVHDLRQRVSRLEQTLLRNLWLLVANLLAVVFSLIQQGIFARY